MPRPILVLLLGCTSLASLSGQSTLFLIDKAIDYSQSDNSTPTFNSDIGHSFIAQVADMSGTYNASNPAVDPTVDDGSTTWTLVYNNDFDAWYYEDSGYASEAALDTVYADTNYNFNFDSNTATVAVSADLYSNIPMASMNIGSWSGGTFIVASNQAFTISTNTFTTNYLNGASRIEIRINGDSFSDSANNNNSGDSLTLDLDAFDLTAGDSYEVEIAFTRFDGSDAMLSGTDTYGSYTSITTFNLHAVPKPDSFGLWVGLGALGMICRRRQRRGTGRG